MTIPSIAQRLDESPEAPQRSNRATFAALGDPFMKYIEGLPDNWNDEIIPELNTVITAMNQNLVDAVAEKEAAEAAQEAAENARDAAIAVSDAYLWSVDGSSRAFAEDERLVFSGGLYICLAATTAGQSPTTHPEKWAKISTRAASIRTHTVTGNFTTLDVDGTVTHTNAGATGAVIKTWPTPQTGQAAKVAVTAGQYFGVTAPAGVTIRAGSAESISGGYVKSNVVGDWIDLQAVSTTEIIVTSIGGSGWLLETS